METRDYIQDLEERYKQYCNKKSGVSFNRNTDIFMEELYSMPIAKITIEELLREYPVKDEKFTFDQEQDVNYLTDIFLEMNQDKYIASNIYVTFVILVPKIFTMIKPFGLIRIMRQQEIG